MKDKRSNKEEIIKRFNDLAEMFEQLPKEEQRYVAGVIQGLTFNRENKSK